MKMGLLRGVGQGLSNLGSNRIAQENKEAERLAEQGIWEARQQRLQSLGLESFEKQQEIKEASAEQASGREYEQKKGLLSMKTDEDIRKAKELQGMGISSGKTSTPADIQTHQYLMKQLGLEPEEAWNVLKRSKGDPRELFADIYDKRRKYVDENMVDESAEATTDYVKNVMTQAGFPGFGAKAATSVDYATAPQSAIDYLKQNPNLKDQFKAKYGYLPEGY